MTDDKKIIDPLDVDIESDIDISRIEERLRFNTDNEYTQEIKKFLIQKLRMQMLSSSDESDV